MASIIHLAIASYLMAGSSIADLTTGPIRDFSFISLWAINNVKMHTKTQQDLVKIKNLI
jgi:hypothetical protein